MRLCKGQFAILSQLLLGAMCAAAQALPAPIVKTPFASRALGWSADDGRFALGEENIIFVRDSDSSMITHTMPLGQVLTLNFSDEGGRDMLLALSADGSAQVYDLDEATQSVSGEIRGGGTI